MLSGRHILLGVTGGIAAYKAAYLVRAFQKKGALVRVIMTSSASRFIGEETFSALTGHEVGIHTFVQDDSLHYSSADAESAHSIASEQFYNPWTRHIQWGEWADLFVIAPCTANTIAKITHGNSDNLLTAAVLASRAPILICPTMDGEMMNAPATTHNLELLKSRGFHLLEPEEGYLASGLMGKGRLPEPDDIVAHVEELLVAEAGPLYGKKVVVTAGPTREHIDPVRFISNPSSGKMGLAMVKAAQRLGGQVHLVHGPISLTIPEGIQSYAVLSAQEMFEQVKALYPADIFIKAAAVSDFKPATIQKHKIKKRQSESQIFLAPTPDILKWIGDHKDPHTISIGFAMETTDLLEQAKAKRTKKKADWIIANYIGSGQQGFESHYNKVILVGDGIEESFEGPKDDLAMSLLRSIFLR
tara:strand:+ start:12549 stop:13796 length:1248 start_codon:yes stop_codon:yes gene_type:complete